MGFRWPCLKQELQQHQPPVNGVSAIFTGSRECTTLNPILESQHSGEPGLAVGIAGSSSRECSASELGGRHGRASMPNILRLPSESALTSTTEREGCLLSKSSCQQLGCRGTVAATVLSLGNWKNICVCSSFEISQQTPCVSLQMLKIKK